MDNKKRGRPTKHDKPRCFNVRLSGKHQIKIFDELKQIEQKTGRPFVEIVRNMLQIGINGHNNLGATISMDGEVIYKKQL